MNGFEAGVASRKTYLREILAPHAHTLPLTPFHPLPQQTLFGSDTATNTKHDMDKVPPGTGKRRRDEPSHGIGGAGDGGDVLPPNSSLSVGSLPPARSTSSVNDRNDPKYIVQAAQRAIQYTVSKTLTPTDYGDIYGVSGNELQAYLEKTTALCDNLVNPNACGILGVAGHFANNLAREDPIRRQGIGFVPKVQNILLQALRVGEGPTDDEALRTIQQLHVDLRKAWMPAHSREVIAQIMGYSRRGGNGRNMSDFDVLRFALTYCQHAEIPASAPELALNGLLNGPKPTGSRQWELLAHVIAVQRTAHAVLSNAPNTPTITIWRIGAATTFDRVNQQPKFDTVTESGCLST